MLLIVTMTGLSGLLISFGLLRAGLVEMWLRYPISFGIAYLIFLGLLWLWLRTRAEDFCDLPDLSGLPATDSLGSGVHYAGKGGESGGGGASGSFDDGATGGWSYLNTAESPGNAINTVADAEEFAIPLAALLLLGALLFSSFFIIYSAPVLFAELLVDAFLSASLYRRLRGLDVRHWLETALRRTAMPFLLTAALVSLFGWGMGRYAPEAHSIGEVISHARLGG